MPLTLRHRYGSQQQRLNRTNEEDNEENDYDDDEGEIDDEDEEGVVEVNEENKGNHLDICNYDRPPTENLLSGLGDVLRLVARLEDPQQAYPSESEQEYQEILTNDITSERYVTQQPLQPPPLPPFYEVGRYRSQLELGMLRDERFLDSDLATTSSAWSLQRANNSNNNNPNNNNNKNQPRNSFSRSHYSPR